MISLVDVLYATTKPPLSQPLGRDPKWGHNPWVVTPNGVTKRFFGGRQSLSALQQIINNI